MSFRCSGSSIIGILLCSAIGIIASTGTLYAQADGEILPVEARAAISFKPFTFEELFSPNGTTVLNPKTNLPVTLDDTVSVGFSGESRTGTIRNIVDVMNRTEESYTKYGRSLREGLDKYVIVGAFNDPAKRAAELVNQLKLVGSDLEKKIASPLKNCKEFTTADLGRIYSGTNQIKTVALPDGGLLPVQDFIGRLNEQQRSFCKMGYDLIGDVSSYQSLDELFAHRKRVIQTLGIDELASNLGFGEYQALKGYDDIVKEVQAAALKAAKPGPEMLGKISAKIAANIPENEFMPVAQSLKSPEKLEIKSMGVKKEKVWKGMEFGNSTFGTAGDARLLIQGDERRQYVTASGNLNVIILGSNMTVVGGEAVFSSEPGEVSATFSPFLLGQQQAQMGPMKSQKLIDKPDGTIFDIQKDEKFARGQVVICGIPVHYYAGVGGRLALLYAYYVSINDVWGHLLPLASSHAFGGVAVGVDGLASVGVEAELTIVNASVPLVGRAGLLFDPEGIPFLKAEIVSNLRYDLLSGRFYAYGEVPVIGEVLSWFSGGRQYGRETVDIFSWDGIGGKEQLLNWGIEIGRRSNNRIYGDLVSKTDRDEYNKLDQELRLDQKRAVMQDYAQRTATRSNAMFDAIRGDSMQNHGEREALAENALSVAKQDELAKKIRDALGNFGG